MTIRDSQTRAQYEAHNNAGTVYATATNEAFEALSDVIKSHGLKVDNCDGAENLVTQIFAFLWDSNNSEPQYKGDGIFIYPARG